MLEHVTKEGQSLWIELEIDVKIDNILENKR